MNRTCSMVVLAMIDCTVGNTMTSCMVDQATMYCTVVVEEISFMLRTKDHQEGQQKRQQERPPRRILKASQRREATVQPTRSTGEATMTLSMSSLTLTAVTSSTQASARTSSFSPDPRLLAQLKSMFLRGSTNSFSITLVVPPSQSVSKMMS